jgi:hypothetical protein
MRIAFMVGIVAVSPAGCVWQSTLHWIERRMDARNEQRYRAAEASLQAKGYRFSDEDIFREMLPSKARHSCEQALLAESHREMDEYFHGPKPTPLLPGLKARETAERMVVPVKTAKHSSTIDMDAAVMDACRFFGYKSDRLEVRTPDGGAALLIHVGPELRPARDANGQLVLVVVSKRVVSRHRILVKATCDRMPGVSDSWYGRWGFVIVTAPPARIDMMVPEEKLDVRCTTNLL